MRDQNHLKQGVLEEIYSFLPASASELIGVAAADTFASGFYTKYYLILIILMFLGLCGCDKTIGPLPAAGTVKAKGCLEITDVDLGVIPSGGSQSKIVKARNLLERDIDIDKFELSCSCMTVRPHKYRIEALGECYLRIDIDLAKEPDFVGVLKIDVHGIDRSHVQIAGFQVHLTIVHPKELGMISNLNTSSHQGK